MLLLGHPRIPLTRFREHGFSLIELMVVIAVIAILAAIFYAVAGPIRQRAWATQSASNKRVIYTAMMLFDADNGHLPRLMIADKETQTDWEHDTGWHTILAAYIQHDEMASGKRSNAADVMYDPAQPEHDSLRPDFGVAYNQTHGPIRKELRDNEGILLSEPRSYAMSELANPAKTPLLADCEQLSGSEVVGSWFFSSIQTSLPELPGPRLSFRHSGKTQMIFADGSMRSLTEEEVYSEVLPWKNTWDGK